MKRLNIILLIIASVLVAGYFVIRFYLRSDEQTDQNGKPESSAASLDLRPMFIARIQQLVKDGSKGLYGISIDSVDVDVLQSRVILRHVQLWHNGEVLKTLDSMKEAPDDVFNIAFDSLTIEGINMINVIRGNKIDLKEVSIIKPTIEIFRKKRPYNRNVDSLTLYDRVMKNMERIAIGKVSVQRGKLVSYDEVGDKKTFDNITIRLNDILVDSSTEKARDRFLFAKHASFSLDNYEVRTKDDAYIVRIGSLNVTAPEKKMTIRDLSLRSRYSRKEFQQRLTHQKEQYNLFTPYIALQNIDWWALMNDDLFVADELMISGGTLNIYLDRSLPRPKSKMGNFPHQLIMKLPFKIDVARAIVERFDLTYQEYNPKSSETGSIKFNDIKLNLSGITNLPAQRKKKKQTVVTGSALFKNIPVKAKLAFDLQNYKSGRFSASFSTGGFEGKLVNDISHPLGLIKLEKGHINKLEVSMQGDEQKAKGKVLMLYNDLKISIYESEKNKEELDKRKFLGFIVNSFVVKNNNPFKNNPPRSPDAESNRNPQTGFFNLVWKTTLNGILKTVGANPALIGQ